MQNAIEDGAVVPGAGAFEIAAAADLEVFKKTVTGKAKRGVEAFAGALLVIPKTLAENSGFDVSVRRCVARRGGGGTFCPRRIQSSSCRRPRSERTPRWGSTSTRVSRCCQNSSASGTPRAARANFVSFVRARDNLRVKRQTLHLAPVLASQLLMVDEVMRAGRGSRNAPSG